MNGLYDEIRVAIHNVWKRRWLALLVAWGVCLAGWLVISLIPNRYESTAQIFVQMQSLLPDKIGINPADRQREVDRVKQTLTSQVNLEKVVRGTSLGKNLNTPKEVSAAAAGLKDKIKVVDKRENLFEISAQANLGGISDRENAKLSRDMVQSLIDIFVEDNLNGNRTETTSTLQFLDAQLADLDKKLKDAETARVTFETKNMGLLPGVGSSATRRDMARAELNQVESSLVAAQSALASINGQLAGTPPTISAPSSYIPGGGPATARVAQLEGQIAEAQSRGWTESHPDMQSLQNQLGKARLAADREASGRTVGGLSSSNPAYSSLRAMAGEKQSIVSAMIARRAQLNAELTMANARQIEEPTLAAEQGRLNQEYNGIKAQYDKLLADREDVKLRGQMNTTSNPVKYRVITPPTVPTKPSAPDRPMLLTGILLVGLAIGAGVAFVMSQLQTGFATAKRLTTVSGMPVLGSVSEVMNEKQRRGQTKKNKVFLGGAGALGIAYILLIMVDMFQRSGVA
jgi:polysaccharide chain length determinant protein (PEP-CTERM system associated)